MKFGTVRAHKGSLFFFMFFYDLSFLKIDLNFAVTELDQLRESSCKISGCYLPHTSFSIYWAVCPRMQYTFWRGAQRSFIAPFRFSIFVFVRLPGFSFNLRWIAYLLRKYTSKNGQYTVLRITTKEQRGATRLCFCSMRHGDRSFLQSPLRSRRRTRLFKRHILNTLLDFIFKKKKIEESAEKIEYLYYSIFRWKIKWRIINTVAFPVKKKSIS